MNVCMHFRNSYIFLFYIINILSNKGNTIIIVRFNTLYKNSYIKRRQFV
jgi:hypothetical protein